MEKKEQVKPIRVTLHCDDCRCEMDRSNHVLAPCPPPYQYECPRCKAGINSRQLYPRIEYVSVGDYDEN